MNHPEGFGINVCEDSSDAHHTPTTAHDEVDIDFSLSPEEDMMLAELLHKIPRLVKSRTFGRDDTLGVPESCTRTGTRKPPRLLFADPASTLVV